ncbi:TetR family transcriptional regulator [Paracoccus sp. YIM 132242]|uniref:TetR family transcriptional regulator n=1 Tax=Paracoccus lichenicola TaxID=2665644 RepID=A0A6L6HTP8_9RHOB|nr:TetR/AcrR family transcriptional regulator [Paracoccus lichenicola]MTE01642.1 TetR family transcriptional regulator [Paracoccus lichenicola]
MARPITTKPASRRLPRDQRMAAILRAARDVLRDRGSEQFTTAEVAERCGTSEGTIYKYFPTRRDLLLQVAESWFEEFLAEDYPARTDGPIAEKLYHAIWWSLSIVRREPALTRLVLMELRADPGYRKMAVYDQNRIIVERVMRIVQEGQLSGAFRPELDIRLIRDMIFGAIEHQTWAYLRGEGNFSVDASAAGITEVVMRGIVTGSPPDDPLSSTVNRLERIALRMEKSLGGT